LDKSANDTNVIDIAEKINSCDYCIDENMLKENDFIISLFSFKDNERELLCEIIDQKIIHGIQTYLYQHHKNYMLKLIDCKQKQLEVA
jgi:hypothetical protein